MATRDFRRPSSRSHAARKKSARQLDREIAAALTGRSGRSTAGRATHATKIGSAGRWNHRAVARTLQVPEDVVRRIYAAVQTAKRQGLHSGYYADFVERSVGRKLMGNEYDVAARAKEHLGYDPPGGYGGPKPKGTAKEPPRPTRDDPKINRALDRASRIEGGANRILSEVLRRRKHPTFGWDWSNGSSKDRELLREVADELDVAADLYEEAGVGVHAGTLRERARHARQGDYRLLAAYDPLGSAR